MKTLLALLFVGGAALAAAAQTDRAALERSLQETLDGARLVGQFTVVGGDGASRPPQADQYAVSRLERDAEGRWVFNVSMSYGTQQHTMPVPVTIEWAGDTPMITLTEQTIPGLGTFTARVLLHDGLYAGTWKHGQFGGHMWGRIEPAGAETTTPSAPPAAAPAAPAAPATDAASATAPPPSPAP
jgi:hypothetical protein